MNQLQGLPAFGCAQSQSAGALPTKNKQSSSLQKLATGGYVRCQYCCGLCVWCPNYCACSYVNSEPQAGAKCYGSAQLPGQFGVCAIPQADVFCKDGSSYVHTIAGDVPLSCLATNKQYTQTGNGLSYYGGCFYSNCKSQNADFVGLNQDVITNLQNQITKAQAAGLCNAATLDKLQLAAVSGCQQKWMQCHPQCYAAGLSLYKNKCCIFKQIATPVLDIAAAATGQAWAIPLINGGMTIVNGGSPLDALKAAGTAYLSGQAGGFLNGAGITNPIAQQVITNAANQGLTTGKIDPTKIAESIALNYGENAALKAADITDPTASAFLKNAATQGITTGNINPLSLITATGMAAAKDYAKNSGNSSSSDSTGPATSLDKYPPVVTSNAPSPIDMTPLPDDFTSNIDTTPGIQPTPDIQPVEPSPIDVAPLPSDFTDNINPGPTIQPTPEIQPTEPSPIDATPLPEDFTSNIDTSSNLQNVVVTGNKDQTPTYDNVDVVGQRPSDTINTIRPTQDIQPVTPGLQTVNDLPSGFLDNIDTSDPLQNVTVVGKKPDDTTIQPVEPGQQPVNPVKLDVTTPTTPTTPSGSSSSSSSSSGGGGSSSGLQQPTQPAFSNAESVLKSYVPTLHGAKLASLKQLYDSLDPELKQAMGASFETPEAMKPEEINYKDLIPPSDFDKEVPIMPKSKTGGLIHMAGAGSVSDAVDDLVSSNTPTMQSVFNDAQKAFQPTPMRSPASTGLASDSKYVQAAKQRQLQHLYESISPALRGYLVGGPVVGMGGMAEGGLPARYHPEAPEGHHPEFITGQTGYYAAGRGTGQSDDIPAMLHDGDYVIDADSVAQLGDGSSKAGAQALEHFRNQIPHHAHGGPASPVPAKIADGEYVLPAAFVTALGGGDNKTGSKLLDKMRKELREHKRSAPVNKIPPKAKSPLDYLRMAKG